MDHPSRVNGSKVAAIRWKCCHNRSLRSIDLYLPSRDQHRQMIIIRQASSSCTSTACSGWLGDPIGGFSHSHPLHLFPHTHTLNQWIYCLLIFIIVIFQWVVATESAWEFSSLLRTKTDPDMELQFKICLVGFGRKFSVQKIIMSMADNLGGKIIGKCTLRDPDLQESADRTLLL